MREIKFRGRSGQSYSFTRMAPNAPWARMRGVALFAAQGAFNLRAIRLCKLRGRAHDVQPLWAFADAERYGARAVFVLAEDDAERIEAVIADLEAGLDPVCPDGAPVVALAA
ncbi:MAG: hypothetical protein AAFR74_04500 [Pseudomonadota bacterium]